MQKMNTNREKICLLCQGLTERHNYIKLDFYRMNIYALL